MRFYSARFFDQLLRIEGFFCIFLIFFFFLLYGSYVISFGFALFLLFWKLCADCIVIAMFPTLTLVVRIRIVFASNEILDLNSFNSYQFSLNSFQL